MTRHRNGGLEEAVRLSAPDVGEVPAPVALRVLPVGEHLTGYRQRGRPPRVAGAQRRRSVGDSSRKLAGRLVRTARTMNGAVR